MESALIAGQRLEFRWIGPGPGEAPTIVFLHEALDVLPAVLVHFGLSGAVLFDHMAALEAYETTNLRERLARHHGGNTDALFRAWYEIWLRPAFGGWNIEESLPSISCPVLVIQGEDDQYGTVRQVETVVSQVRGPARSLVLPGCGHAPHAERRDEVLAAAAGFIHETFPVGYHPAP